jgi:amino acid adenylation domain-containing protein
MTTVAMDSARELHRIATRLARLPEDKQLTFLKQLREHGIAFHRLPIVPGPRPARLPLSYAQRQQWILWKLRPDGSAYHLAVALRLRGTLDRSALQGAFDALIERHESLRTSFHMQDGEVFQQIAARASVPIRAVSAVGEAHVRTLMNEEMQRPFDLEAGLPLRVLLIQLGPTDHVLLLALHHIVADAWSLDLIREEIVALYCAQRAGRPAALPPLPIQYADFALWQRRWMEAGELDRQLAYWRDRLGETAAAQELLPTDRPRTDALSNRGGDLDVDLGPELTAQVERFAQARGATVFAVLLASVKVLLARYSGQSDVRVGVPIANRQRVETEALVGFCVNTQVLRTDLGGDADFETVVSRLQSVIHEALAHQDLPFERLVEALNPQRGVAHNPLFHVLYTHEVRGRAQVRLPGLEVEPVVQPNRTAQVDLSIATTQQDGRILASFLYATDLYDHDTIARAAGHWRNLLQRLVENPRTPIRQIELLSETERRQVLAQQHETSRLSKGPQSLHGLIEEQVSRTPRAVCLVHNDRTLDYAGLSERAGDIAGGLRARGVQPDELVAICMDRSIEMVVGLLGILKIGAAYVPLDPDYPAERLAFMLKDAQPRVVLTQRRLVPLVESLGGNGKVWCLDEAVDRGGYAPQPSAAVHPESLAYCIYTSGSTGTPKGVAVRHGGIVNLLECVRDKLRMHEGERLLALASLSFDVSCVDIFLPLVSGARVVLVDRAVATDPHAVLNCIRREGITLVQATPTMWRMLVDHDKEGALARCSALCGGESLPSDLADRLVGRAHSVRNLYGPTETTVYSAVHALTITQREPLIGRPLDNTVIYILDESLQLAPPGVVGDLYIGGAGLARGYRNRPGLTAERFVPDPFARHPGERLYRTGDLGRYRADGVLECLGRSDHQVKIRGFRVELEEIEARLRSHEGVRDAAVGTHVDSDGVKYLVAYIATPDRETLTEDAQNQLFHRLSEHLKAGLPPYMVPAHYVCLPELPSTPNGKLDRKALRAPESTGHARQPFVAPNSTLERDLVALWEEALGVKPIGIHDNFFELGGHSLLAVQLTDAISRCIGRTVPLSQLFQSQCVAELAEALSTVHCRNDGRSLVVLEADGDEPALCCIHPGGGQVLGYRPLARSFRGRRPVYGLQSRLFYRDDFVDDSFESMARHYAEQIQLQVAGRPVHLLGWSAGCIIAAEVARHLLTQGHPVRFVGMIDPVTFLDQVSLAPDASTRDVDVEKLEDSLLKWIERSRCRVRWSKLIDLCDRQTHLELLRWFAAEKLDQKNLAAGDEYVRLTEAHYFMLLRKYRFEPLAMEIDLWWADATLALHGVRSAPLPAGMNATVRAIDADHLSIVHSAALHSQIRSVLEQRDGAHLQCAAR